MSEGGDIPNPTMDQNPNQGFKSTHEISSPISLDQNPNQYLKNPEKPLEPFSISFGDLITIVDPSSPNKRSVVIDVGTEAEFSVGHLEKSEDGKELLSPLSISTQGANQPYIVIERWTPEQIKEVIENYYQSEQAKTVPTNEDSEEVKEKKLKQKSTMERMKISSIARVDKWAQQNQSRKVTVEDIKNATLKENEFINKFGPGGTKR